MEIKPKVPDTKMIEIVVLCYTCLMDGGLEDMTEEEAQYWSDYFMENPPKTDPIKPGVFAWRKANRFSVMDNLTVNYLLTKSIETHKSPEEIIGELVCKEIAVTT